MTDNKDPNLQAPQEANTTKHINFRETEEAEADAENAGHRSDNTDAESPAKKAWEELRKQNKKE